MAGAAQMMRIRNSSNILIDSYQQRGGDRHDADGNTLGDGNAPADEVYEGLRSRFEMVQTHIATDYAHVIGDATVTEALENLQAAMNRSDGEAFETAHSSLNMAVTALAAPEDSD
jgi:hypothetical protein